MIIKKTKVIAALIFIGLTTFGQTKTFTGILEDYTCGDTQCSFGIKKSDGNFYDENITLEFDNTGKIKINPEMKDVVIKDPSNSENEMINPKYKGKKYSFICTAKNNIYYVNKIEGEGVASTSPDSAQIEFNKKYSVWIKETAKFDLANKASNPGAVAKKFLELGKKGDLAGMKAISEESEANKTRYSKGVYKQISSFTKIASQNTPEATKNEIAKVFLSGFTSVLLKPVVYYMDANNASVAVDRGKRLYFITLAKIAGQWKVTKMNDDIELKPMDGRGSTEEFQLANKIVEKRVKELNP